MRKGWLLNPVTSAIGGGDAGEGVAHMLHPSARMRGGWLLDSVTEWSAGGSLPSAGGGGATAARAVEVALGVAAGEGVNGVDVAVGAVHKAGSAVMVAVAASVVESK